MDGFSAATLASFELIKKALLGDTEPFRESNLSLLWNISRKPQESLSTYRERIAGLVEKIYPKFASANKQCLIRDIFVHSLPADYQKFLVTSNSAKIEEAVNCALLYESMKVKATTDNINYKSVYHKDKKRGMIRHEVTERSSSSGDKVCNFCHKPGHFARDCYKKKRYLEEKSTQESR